MKSDDNSYDLEKEIDNSKMKINLNVALSTLKAREERALRMYWEIGYKSKNDYTTYREIGEQFSITGNRVRDIILKALRKMKHPSRTKDLGNIFDEVA